jgi:hypothetical protein
LKHHFVQLPQHILEPNHKKVSKVEYWNVVVAKLHNLLTCHAINRALAIPSEIVVHNEKGGFQLKEKVGTKIQTSNGFVKFKCSTIDVGYCGN